MAVLLPLAAASIPWTNAPEPQITKPPSPSPRSVAQVLPIAVKSAVPVFSVQPPSAEQLTKMEKENIRTVIEASVTTSHAEPPPKVIARQVPLEDLEAPVEFLQQLQAEIDSKRTGLPGGLLPSASRSDTSATSITSGKTENQSTRPFAYHVRSFIPGKTKSGAAIQRQPVDLASIRSVVGGPPDYSLDLKDAPKNRVLSLGNGGVIVLEIDSGEIVDQPGIDFIIYENPFVIDDSKGASVYGETAIVSVSEEDRDEAYKTFPCEKDTPPYHGCAGVIPVRYNENLPLIQTGGDSYDLSTLGLKRIRFIRIQDTGDNESFLEGTEGFDLDAIALVHTDP